MPQETIFYPLVVLVSLTAFVAIRLLLLRIQAVRKGELKVGYFRMNQGADAPAVLTRTTQHYDNLFEMPLLFYAIVIVLFVTSRVDMFQLVLAWSYVVLRLGHAFIHITYNNVMHRMYVFLVSTVVMFVMWFSWFRDTLLA